MPRLTDALDDLTATLVDPETFGEAITYRPRGASAVTINAVIDRNPPVVTDGVTRPKMTALIRNHATLGRTSINTGGDVIVIDGRDMLVGRVIRQDVASWYLSLG